MMEEQFLVWLHTYGAVALFLISFLAATILPFSSEVAFSAAIVSGIAPLEALLYASVGNVLATLFNYGIGRTGSKLAYQKFIATRWGALTERWHTKYGTWILLLSWLPFIGDPITILAGFLRIPLGRFALIVGSLRILRYYAIIIAITGRYSLAV